MNKSEINSKRKSDCNDTTGQGSDSANSSVDLSSNKKLKITLKSGKSDEPPAIKQPESSKPTTTTVDQGSAAESTTQTNKSETDLVMTLPKPVIKPSVGASLKPVAVTASTAGQLVVKNVSQKVAKVFGDDDDDSEEEEMPLEAKMKMRNKGRNTPTSTGPNSYGKTSLGFTDTRKLLEKQLKEKAEELLKQDD